MSRIGLFEKVSKGSRERSMGGPPKRLLPLVADWLLSVPSTRGTVDGGSGIQHAAIDRSLALLSLIPGDHVLTVTVNLPGGDPVTRTIGFRIV
jgi:hypothetical protein